MVKPKTWDLYFYSVLMSPKRPTPHVLLLLNSHTRSTFLTMPGIILPLGMLHIIYHNLYAIRQRRIKWLSSDPVFLHIKHHITWIILLLKLFTAKIDPPVAVQIKEEIFLSAPRIHHPYWELRKLSALPSQQSVVRRFQCENASFLRSPYPLYSSIYEYHIQSIFAMTPHVCVVVYCIWA